MIKDSGGILVGTDMSGIVNKRYNYCMYDKFPPNTKDKFTGRTV